MREPAFPRSHHVLPNFRVKQNAVPGMTPEVIFVPTRKGDFEIACAELCGLAHYRMRGFFHVVAVLAVRLLRPDPTGDSVSVTTPPTTE